MRNRSALIGVLGLMKTWASIGFLCLICAGSCAAASRNGKRPELIAPATPPRTDVAIPRIDQPLHLADFANMEPRATLRSKLSMVSDFIQNSPVDGQLATERTEVWMAHTHSSLYFIFICYDRHPELIRSHLARRENILNDDMVTVLLDPFRDRRIGVGFRLNPAGVQADAAWSEANGTDYSYDTVWDSEGQVTKVGWMALFATDDRQPGEAVAPGDPLYLKHSTVAVGRVSQDLGKGSSLGAIYTDVEFGGGWNRIGGADCTIRFDKHWTAWGQMVESSTMGDQDSGTPRPYAAGPAGIMQFQRSGHSFNLNDTYSDLSTGFQTQLGFIQSANFRNNHLHANYQWFPKHRLYQSFGIETDQNIAFDHQGDRVFHYSTFDVFWLLPRNLVLAPVVGENSDTLSPLNYSALTGFRNFTENFGGFVAHGAPWSQLNFNLQALRSGNVNYNPAPGQAPSLLNQETVSLLFTWQPVRPLTADNTYLLDRDHAVSNGDLVYESQTMRSKVNYQFTRSISARVIVEYDSTVANPVETSLLHTRQVASQALLTWLPHPGTAVYIGYSNDMQNLDRSLCNRLPNGVCDPNNTAPPRAGPLLNDGRQIFIKASYLFRF